MDGMAYRFRNSIGPIIRRLRSQLEWTQEELAAKLQLAGLHHLDRFAVSKIESQVRSVYDYESIILAKVLKVEVGDLFPKVEEVEADLERLIGDPREE